jgi:hypothetical protein
MIALFYFFYFVLFLAGLLVLTGLFEGLLLLFLALAYYYYLAF